MCLWIIHNSIKEKYFISTGITGIMLLYAILSITTDIFNNVSAALQFIFIFIWLFFLIAADKYESERKEENY
ncbi:hypothetical protein [Bacillus manliponensis]|uniref:hypothetical protein n=1 Tax=Bacillus manliponensis TaxID=574376 RepID=UPI0035168B31